MSNPDYTVTGVALSNETILILCSFGFASLGIVLFLILRNQPKQDEDDEHNDRDHYGDELDQADVATLNRAQRRARAKYKMKQARRGMAPVVAARGGDGGDNNMPAEGGVQDDDVNDNVAAVADRKERQRIAKQMERNERKIYSMEAQRWRDKNQASSKKKKKLTYEEDNDVASESNFSVEDIFPQRLDKNDPLSDVLFWEYIVRGIKDATLSADELMSRCEAAQSKAMTMREFIKRVECYGSVSIIDLADEFEISTSDALIEIARWNDLYNINGMVDSCGNFVINATQ